MKASARSVQSAKPVSLISDQAVAVRNKIDIWLLAVEQQLERASRVMSQEEKDDFMVGDRNRSLQRRAIDVELWLVCVQRFVRVAKSAQSRFDPIGVLQAAIEEFESTFSDIRSVRNKTEHIDDHPGRSYGFSVGQPNPILTHAGGLIMLGDATTAARKLHRVARMLLDPLANANIRRSDPIIRLE